MAKTKGRARRPAPFLFRRRLGLFVIGQEPSGLPVPEVGIDAAMLDQPARLLIWRQDTTPMFRELSAEEAMMWDEAAKGVPFGVLCEMLATYDDPDGAAARGAGYLHNWITSGILTDVSVGA